MDYSFQNLSLNQAKEHVETHSPIIFQTPSKPWDIFARVLALVFGISFIVFPFSLLFFPPLESQGVFEDYIVPILLPFFGLAILSIAVEPLQCIEACNKDGVFIFNRSLHFFPWAMFEKIEWCKRRDEDSGSLIFNFKAPHLENQKIAKWRHGLAISVDRPASGKIEELRSVLDREIVNSEMPGT